MTNNENIKMTPEDEARLARLFQTPPPFVDKSSVEYAVAYINGYREATKNGMASAILTGDKASIDTIREEYLGPIGETVVNILARQYPEEKDLIERNREALTQHFGAVLYHHDIVEDLLPELVQAVRDYEGEQAATSLEEELTQAPSYLDEEEVA